MASDELKNELRSAVRRRASLRDDRLLNFVQKRIEYEPRIANLAYLSLNVVVDMVWIEL